MVNTWYILWFTFFYMGFFHGHSRIAGLKRMSRDISLTPHYHFRLLHRHLDVSLAITAESSPLNIGSIWSQTGTFSFQAQVDNREFKACLRNGRSTFYKIYLYIFIRLVHLWNFLIMTGAAYFMAWVATHKEMFPCNLWRNQCQSVFP